MISEPEDACSPLPPHAGDERCDEEKLYEQQWADRPDRSLENRQMLASGFSVGREKAAEHQDGDGSDPMCQNTYLKPNDNCNLRDAGQCDPHAGISHR